MKNILFTVLLFVQPVIAEVADTESGAVVCSRLHISPAYKEACPMFIGDMQITKSAESACSSILFNDTEKVACLTAVGEFEIPDSIVSICFHLNYGDDRLKCLVDNMLALTTI